MTFNFLNRMLYFFFYIIRNIYIFNIQYILFNLLFNLLLSISLNKMYKYKSNNIIQRINSIYIIQFNEFNEFNDVPLI